VKTASEITYTVSSGALNSTPSIQPYPRCLFSGEQVPGGRGQMSSRALLLLLLLRARRFSKATTTTTTLGGGGGGL